MCVFVGLSKRKGEREGSARPEAGRLLSTSLHARQLIGQSIVRWPRVGVGGDNRTLTLVSAVLCTSSHGGSRGRETERYSYV